MDKISFLLESNKTYDTNILNVSQNTIKIVFHNDIPSNSTLLSGFYIVNEHNGKNMSGDSYHKYNTLYKKVDDITFMLSNDESVYIEPETNNTEDIPMPELTEEEKS